MHSVINSNYICTRFSYGHIRNDFSACKMDYEGHLKGLSLKIEIFRDRPFKWPK